MPRYRFPPPTVADKRPAPAAKPPSLDLFQTNLEKNYPRVLEAIQSMWGYKELNQYFRKLTMDERGDRAGFPEDVWDDLYTLLRLHQEIVPESLF